MRHLILAMAFLSGCTTVVPSGVARLATLSPLEADPADLAVSLDLPKGISIVENSAKLTLSATRSDTDVQSQETYVLAKTVSEDGTRIYAVAHQDYVRMRTQQKLLRGWEAEADEATQGSLGVTLEGCTLESGPAQDATISINIRTSQKGRFFPLVRKAPVADVLQLGAFDPLTPCL